MPQAAVANENGVEGIAELVKYFHGFTPYRRELG